MCLSDLTLQTPKGQNPFKMGPQNTSKQPLRHYKIRYLRALGPIFVQIGPILSNLLGPLLEGLLRILGAQK